MQCRPITHHAISMQVKESASSEKSGRSLSSKPSAPTSRLVSDSIALSMELSPQEDAVGLSQAARLPLGPKGGGMAIFAFALKLIRRSAAASPTGELGTSWLAAPVPARGALEATRSFTLRTDPLSGGLAGNGGSGGFFFAPIGTGRSDAACLGS